eukprot:TRINITY_DN74586_c0_g1_i1.p1 TRINITY_DN74586_c0_g1~~TRINITY_DN74586_c0_g1_i1.p1  ORF type:complete len:300 (+),score=41.08 TRINITY_DN74586_c0_g1_i1:92-991(+)
MGSVATCNSACTAPPCCVVLRPSHHVTHRADVLMEDAFCVMSRLGEGGSAVVLKCRDRKTGVIRACKSILKDRASRSVDLYAEVEILSFLQHCGSVPGIVWLFEVFEDDHHLHLLLELCSGGELYERQVQVGVFSNAEAAVLMRQMLQAVGFIHTVGVVHRDLKLENWLLISHEGLGIKLCDFGLSIILKPGELTSGRVGSPYYVAPEVLVGEYDSRADIWSLGVIMFMLLTGSPPFDGADVAAILSAISSSSAPLDDTCWPASSPARELVRCLLLKDPRERLAIDDALASTWLMTEPS